MDNLENLDGFKKLVFRHLAMTSEGSLGTKGEKLLNMIS